MLSELKLDQCRFANFAGLGGSFKNKFISGSMAANQSNGLSGTVSATIVRVFPNGNLEIKGQKWE